MDTLPDFMKDESAGEPGDLDKMAVRAPLSHRAAPRAPLLLLVLLLLLLLRNAPRTLCHALRTLHRAGHAGLSQNGGANRGDVRHHRLRDRLRLLPQVVSAPRAPRNRAGGWRRAACAPSLTRRAAPAGSARA